MSEASKNIYLPCVEPLLDTWAVTKQGGDWEMTPPDDLSNTSVEERNTWYAETMMSTIEAFSPLARVYGISFNSLPDKDQEKKIKYEFIEWDLEKPYEKYLEQVFQAVKSYPVDISILYIRVDLFVYVRTEDSPDKPVRAWVRECGHHSYSMADIEMCIEYLIRINLVYFSSVGDPKTRLEGKSFEWQPDEPYDDFIKKISKAVREYTADICAIFINVDLFVYVHTEESPCKPVRSWVRRFGNSEEMGQFEISLDHPRYKENYVYFDISQAIAFFLSY